MSWRRLGGTALRSQIWIEPADVPLAINWLSREKATDVKHTVPSSWIPSSNICIGLVLLVVASHMQAKPSYELLPIIDPSGEKTTAVIPAVCCFNSTHVPFLWYHT